MKKLNRDELFLNVVRLFWFSQYIFVPFLTPHLAALGAAASISGVILGAYGFSQLVLRIPVSVTEDCTGRHRAFMIFGLGALILGSVLPMLSDAPAIYLISRTLAGVGASTWVSFTASFTNGKSNVQERMGKLMAANNLGILVSYLLGGVLYEMIGMKPLFGISAAAAILALCLLPLCQKGGNEASHPFHIGDLWRTLRNPHLLSCSFLGALVQLITFATALSFVNNYAEQSGATGFGLSMVAISFYIAGVAGSWMYSRDWFSRLSESAFLCLSFGLMAIYCLMLPLCQSTVLIILAQLVGGLGRTLAFTHLMASAPSRVDPSQKTTALGIYQSLYSLGMTVGPVVMGWLLDGGSSYGQAFAWITVFAVLGGAWTLLIEFAKRRKN